MTLDQFVEAVRDSLCILGLPLNGGWQPDRYAIAAWHVMGLTVDEVVQRYKSRVRQYEAFVNKRQA